MHTHTLACNARDSAVTVARNDWLSGSLPLHRRRRLAQNPPSARRAPSRTWPPPAPRRRRSSRPSGNLATITRSGPGSHAHRRHGARRVRRVFVQNGPGVPRRRLRGRALLAVGQCAAERVHQPGGVAEILPASQAHERLTFILYSLGLESATLNSASTAAGVPGVLAHLRVHLVQGLEDELHERRSPPPGEAWRETRARRRGSTVPPQPFGELLPCPSPPLGARRRASRSSPA